MESWGVLFLGLIALSSLIQTILFIVLARGAQRLGQRVEELQARLDHEVQPVLANVSRVVENMAGVSDAVARNVQRLDDVLKDTYSKIEETTSMVQKLILRPLGPLVDVMAFIRGIRRGVEAYRQLGGMDTERRGTARRYGDDEHLFI